MIGNIILYYIGKTQHLLERISLVDSMFEKTHLFGRSTPQGQSSLLTEYAQENTGAAPLNLPPEVLQPLRDGSRRIRVLEEQVLRLRKSLQLNEQDSLGKYKKGTHELKTLTEEIDGFKKEFKTLQDKITMLAAELQQFAKKDDVLVLKKYINLWEPVQFVTRNEVERIVADALTKAKKD